MARFRYQRGEKPLEGYTIEHGLGVGGFGEVYFAVSDSGREVALKAVQNYEEIELRGIRHCMNLKSPHLVTVFDVKHNQRGDAFVIMEYVSGPSLRHLLQSSPDGLGATKAAFFLREIAKGMTYLHDAGVVHRDLKPANVFYEEGYVKIGDYSLCKLISNTQNTGHTMTIGSVHYMAPEVSKGRYDSGVDIYALGVMLFEMLTGTPPFTGESIGEVLMKHLNEEPDLSQIEAPFRSVVKLAMNKNPDARYQSPAEMVEAIYGSESVQNSVVAFNPQELTIVAGKVAAGAEQLAGGNGGSPVTFESGDPSAWKAGVDASSVPYATALQDTDSPATNTVVAEPSLRAPEKSVSDPMPSWLRHGLGLTIAVYASVSASRLSALIGFVDAPPIIYTILGFCVVGGAIAVFTTLRRTLLSNVSINNVVTPRVFSFFAGLALMAVSVFCYAMLGLFRGDVPIVSICVFSPFVVLNVHRLMHLHRKKRIQVLPVLGAAFIAASVATFAAASGLGQGELIFVTATLAAGIAAGIQIVSSWKGPVRVVGVAAGDK